MQIVGRVRWRLASLPTLVVDTGLALVVTGLNLAYLWLADPASLPLRGFTGPDLLNVVLVIAWNMSLVLRRRFPVGVLVVVSVFGVLSVPLVVPSPGLGLLVAVYTVGAYSPRRVSLVAMGVVTMGYIALMGFYLPKWGFVAINGLVLFPGAWALGAMQQLRREYSVALEQRAVQLEREREQQARLAVAEERVRIARELHDVLAHHVSVMGIQAAAARRVLTRRPEDAVAALESIEAAGRQAMGELHQLVGLLRREDEVEDRELAPQPGLGQLPALVAGMREAGLSVDLCVEGERRVLPPALELSAFRIVQEALTNTLQHAGPVQAWVTVRYLDHERGVELEVLDNGPGSAVPSRTGGNGLVGMRERAHLHGGRLEAGPRPGGGFRVYAVLDGRVR